MYHLFHLSRFSIKKSVLLLALSTSMTLSQQSYAESNLSQQQVINIPAGPLGKTLAEFAAESGMALSINPELTAGLTSSAVSGSYSRQDALRRILQGSNLEVIQRQDGTYTLQKVSAKAPEMTELPLVTVSGEKIQRSLNRTLSSVAVTTKKDIEQHADQNLQDVMARTPGVYSQSGNENWGIRGVPVSGFDSQGAGTMNGAVSVFVDGSAQTHRLVTMNPLSLWDMDQVEIYRGAQSTTQGRNSLAGAVVLKTNDPTYEPEFIAQTNIGSYGQQGVSFVANNALIEDMVAGRLAVDYQTEDGYIRNETLDKDGDVSRAVNIRGKLLIQPSDDMDLLLTFDRTEHKQGAHTVSAINGKPQYFKHYLNTPEENRLDQNTTSAKFDYYLSDNWSFNSLTSATWSDYQSTLDFDQGVTLEREAQRKHKQRLLSQEIRLTYEDERVHGFFGAYYAKHTNDMHDWVNLNIGGVSDPALDVKGDVTIYNQALFGEINWEFINNWTAIVGLRFDRERNHTKFDYIDPLGLATVSSADDKRSFNELLPKVGLSYQFSQDHIIGLTWQRGYRGGGIDISTSTSHRRYDPEYTNTYELAWRKGWLNQRLNTMANIYHTDWKDQQVELADQNGIAMVANASDATMRGVELSADYQLNVATSIYAAAAYNDTEYKEFMIGSYDASGQPFPFSPKRKLSVGGSYRFTNGLRLSSDVIYQSDSYTLSYVAGTPTKRHNDSVTLVNLNGEYPLSKQLKLTAFVRNVFDREYITNNQSATSLDVGAPRTIGFAIRADM
jgi:iron complex outermembrane recepter protein